MFYFFAISKSVHPYFFLLNSLKINLSFIHSFTLHVSLCSFRRSPFPARCKEEKMHNLIRLVSVCVLFQAFVVYLSLSHPLGFSVLLSLSLALHHSFLISTELLTAELQQSALFSKTQSKWDIILQWIQSVPFSLCVRKNEPVRMCSVCRKPQQYVSACLYTLEWTEFWCVRVLAGRCQEQNRCVIRSSRSAQAAGSVCVRVCEYFSSGCLSVSAKCHEGQESSYITLLNHIHHPVTLTLTWYRPHIQWGLKVWDLKSNLNLEINKGLRSSWNKETLWCKLNEMNLRFCTNLGL